MKSAAHVQQLASGQPVMSYIAHVRKNGDQQKLSEHLLALFYRQSVPAGM